MQTVLWKKTGIFMLVINFIFTTFPAASYAGLVGTDQILSADTRSQHMTEIRNVLTRDDVRTQMLDLGVNPADVEVRLNALTDAELAQLSTGMRDLPAGGDAVAVIGIVFIVLLILELLGVTNVFTKI
ncbi:MAG TPA: PA2779 family protein [Gammaproteobacteria bacterium]|nr:PA2779 family protein [Gammaproteobacteria bacterium]